MGLLETTWMPRRFRSFAWLAWPVWAFLALTLFYPLWRILALGVGEGLAIIPSKSGPVSRFPVVPFARLPTFREVVTGH